MRDHPEREANPPTHPADVLPDLGAESRARGKIRKLWQLGDLFHMSTRYPRKHKAPKIDRLAGILRKGLVAPGRCQDGSVRSDLNILVTGACVPYDSLVFLHLFGELSYIYTMFEPGRFAIFVDPAVPVLTPEAMGQNWVELCQDEVYVRDGIAREKLTAVVVDPADAESVLSEFLTEFRELELPLYDCEGRVLWPPG